MKTLSQLMADKKEYYAKLDEITRLTVLPEVLFNVSEFLKDWDTTISHTEEQAFRVFEIVCSLFNSEKLDLNSASDNGEIIEETQNEIISSQEEDDANYEDVYEEEDDDDEEEDDDFDTVKSVNGMMSLFMQNTGLNLSELSDFCFNFAIVMGLVYPFLKLHDYVLRSKQEFINDLHNGGYAPDIIEEFKASFLSEEDPNLISDCLSDIDFEIYGTRNSQYDMAELINTVRRIKKMTSDEDKVNFKQISQSHIDVLELGVPRIVLFLKGNDYLCDKLSNKEKEAFNSILNQPLFKPIISQWLDEYDRVVSSEESPEETPFCLPSNYFTELKHSSNKDEYLSGSFFDCNVDVNKFVLLIKYIANRGLIENNSYTKQLLAYRLTGRMRPDGDLPKIKWTGGASRGADCLFLMKCSDSKLKYKKMKEFFEADFPSDDRKLPSLVHSARTDFMKKLNALFPEIYKLPNKLK